MLSLINVRLFFFVFRLAFEHEKKSNVARFWPAVAAVSFGWHFSSIYVRTPNGQAQITPKVTDLGFFRGRLWLQTLGNKSRKLLRRGWGLC